MSIERYLARLRKLDRQYIDGKISQKEYESRRRKMVKRKLHRKREAKT